MESERKPKIGPWMGVPEKKMHTCAVKDCISKGKPQVCLYDGKFHHHGCIHYKCDAATVTNHGLNFREGWALLCDFHYAVMKDAFERFQKTRSEEKLNAIRR